MGKLKKCKGTRELIDCKQSLIFLCQVKACKTQVCEQRSQSRELKAQCVL